MKKAIPILLIATALGSGSGCSWLTGDDGLFRDRGHDYRAAAIEPPLQVPNTMSSETIDDRFAIPEISDRASLTEEFVVPRPEPLDSNVDQDVVRINKLGDTQWILVNGAPGQVWPRLRGFLNLNQLGVQRADASSGILETVWLQPTGENALRERYRLRIEQGVQRGSSEVYVLQADIRSGQDAWPRSSNNPERETVMIEELAQYLADSAAAAAVSMLVQQAIDSAGRVSLKDNTDGDPFLSLQLPFSRAWASIGLALEKAGFVIDDLNRDQRLYYLHFVDPDAEEPGFFASLFSSKDDQGIAYLLTVKEIDDSTVSITIQRQEGEETSREEIINRLKLIKRYLS